MLSERRLSPRERYEGGASPERDFVRFSERSEPCPTSGCWLWTGPQDKDGYGIHYAGRKCIRAHRYAYTLAYGPIPTGLVLDHICRQRECVNPDHLRAVTHRENVLHPAAVGVFARNAHKTHCKHGHPFECANVWLDRNGYRQCVTCRAARWKARNKAQWAKKKAARAVANGG